MNRQFWAMNAAARPMAADAVNIYLKSWQEGTNFAA
jgi:hypothetical protein